MCSQCVFFSLHSTISNKINDLSSRIDNLETTLKKDIRTILDILHQQQQVQLHMQQQQQLHLQQQQFSGRGVATTSSGGGGGNGGGAAAGTPYQPSDSEFSFDLCGISGNERQRSNVQRSISQPECANEKSLLKYVKVTQSSNFLTFR